MVARSVGALLLALNALGPPAPTPEPAAPPVAAAPAPEAPAAIAESEVPRAAIAAETRIRALRSLASRTYETDEITASSKNVLESVEALRGWMQARDPAQQTSRALRSIGQEWRLDADLLGGWMETTSNRLDVLGSARAELKRLEQTWELTAAELKGSGAVDELVDRASAVVGSLDALDPALRSETERVLLLQSRISAASLDAEEALDAIAAALREERRGLLRIDAPPIWKAFRPEAEAAPLSGQIAASYRESERALQQYADRSRRQLTFQLALFAVLAVVFFRLRRRAGHWPKDHRDLVACARLVERPLLGAFLVATFSGAWIHPRAPVAFYELSSLLLVVPIVVLMRGVVEPRLRGALYLLAMIFTVERIWELTPAGTTLERMTMLGLTTITGVVLARTIRPPSVVPTLVAGRWWRALTIVGRIAVGALAVAIVANVVGNLSLARLLTATVVRAAYGAVVLYAAALIVRGALTLALRAPWIQSFRAVARHADTILRRAKRVIDAVAVVLFLIITINATGQWSVLRRSVEALLGRRWGIGDFRFSFASVLIFLLAIWASIFVSRILRAILEDDVYPRVVLPRGIPQTLTFVARYSVIAVGFLLAAAIAGIPLDRLAIVLGAFSVGIGFGLQTVVNNFVSGLILMFERPIQIGDAIEVGGLVGRVRSIGVRASRIETFDGAEVVVPNGTLVSNQLINWTLSNRDRRIEVPVGVAYGTDPERVLALLKTAVSGQPGVLASPEPIALFRGFGASSLDLSVFFWTADFDAWTRLKSDMTVRVNAAIREAGIEIPFPQQDIRIRS